MTNPPQEPGDQPTPSNADPTTHRPSPPAGDQGDQGGVPGDPGIPPAGADPTISNAGAADGPVPDPTASSPTANAYPPPPYPAPPPVTGYGQPNHGQPNYGQPGYGYGYPPQPMLPAPPPGGGRRIGLIAGVVGLVAGVGIGAIGIAVATGGDGSKPSTNTALTASASASTAPPSTAAPSATPTGSPGPADGNYSMASVTNACSLINPGPVTKWASTPDGAPEHRETQPSSLRCDVKYATLSKVDDVHYNQAGISVEAEFTDNGADPAYDGWKQMDTGTTGSGLDSGVVTGIGSQAYWASAKADTSDTRLSYVVAVQDSNVSVRVRIAISLAEGEPPVNVQELDTIAKSDARMLLRELRKK